MPSDTITASWQPEGKSEFRAGEGYRAVRISETQSLVQLLGATFGSTQYPDGYYPTCSDLIEVTAQVATPATGQTGIDQLADENLCGPMTVNFYLDPKPMVVKTRYPDPVFDIASQTYTATLDVRVDTAPMMGNITGATYTWEREIWRKDLSASTRTYNLFATWATISLSNPLIPNGNIQSGGTYTEPNLIFEDSLRIHCVMNMTSVTSSNIRLDRTCTTMTSEPVYIVMPERPKKSTLAAAASKGGETASIASTVQSTETNTLADNRKPLPLSQTYTINLLAAPNPAETQVGLSFTVPDDAIVHIEIIDALQRTVMSPLIGQQFLQGAHSVAIPVGTLSSGAYSVRLTARLANGLALVERRTLVIVR